MQVFQFPVRKVSISTVSALVPEAVVFSGGFVPAGKQGQAEGQHKEQSEGVSYDLHICFLLMIVPLGSGGAYGRGALSATEYSR